MLGTSLHGATDALVSLCPLTPLEKLAKLPAQAYAYTVRDASDYGHIQ